MKNILRTNMKSMSVSFSDRYRSKQFRHSAFLVSKCFDSSLTFSIFGGYDTDMSMMTHERSFAFHGFAWSR
jgi:hypothetical protein